MNDYQQILERARKWRSDKCLRYNLSMARRHDAEAYHILTQLLAALDAARGEAVAWAPPDELADARERNAWCGVDTRKSFDTQVPLYAAPPAAAVPEGFAAMVDAADNAYDSAEGVAYVEFYRREPVEKLISACRAMLAAANKENNNG